MNNEQTNCGFIKHDGRIVAVNCKAKTVTYEEIYATDIDGTFCTIVTRKDVYPTLEAAEEGASV